MDLTMIVLLLTILTVAVAELQTPQVHEEIDDSLESNDTQKFNYEENQQTDMQKWRYLQQQAVDARHQERNAKMPKKREVDCASKRDSREFVLFDNPKLFEEGSNEQLQMLNSLIGQAPVLQLQGLQKLLNMRDHTPVMENTVDVANPVDFPNVKAEPAPPEFQEAVANVYVLEADKQRKIKEQQLSANLPKIHPTYGPVIGYHKTPEQSVYSNDQENVSSVRNKREESDDDWYVDYDFDNFTSANLNASSNSDNYEYYYEIYNDGDPEESGEDHRRHYKVVEVPTIVKETKKDDSKPLNYIVINNNNNGAGADGHKAHGHKMRYAANYAFGYQVRDFESGNDFGHEEVARGGMRKGRYHVLLPDGRLQNVNYWADHTGYHAKVTYDKVAVHPKH
ncbi:hypothetical protein FQR65_LT12113 [Abscondita terminalis]|nr:hypothetical protein FQR65_LT12113 [Abscondita terminalis]